MDIVIPGYKNLHLENLVLDYNGTIALDGVLLPEVQEALIRLSEHLSVYVLTADTHGTAKVMCEGLPAAIMTFPGDSAMESKLEIVKKLGAETCVSVGNGRNDCKMCQASALSIAVIGKEGMYSGLISSADVCAASILDALSLLENPKRLIATLRG